MAFWNKKKKNAPSTVSDSVGSALELQPSMPPGVEFYPVMSDAGMCEPIQVDDVSNTYSSVSGDIAVGPGTGYLLSGGFAVSNDSNTGQVRVWRTVPSESVGSIEPVSKPYVHPAQEQWSDSTVMQAICLPQDRSLLVIQYFDGGVVNGRFLFDTNTGIMDDLGVVESDTQAIGQYIFALNLPGGAVIAMHQSDKRRKSAEIYHNYYQHLTLYSSTNPQGLDLLTLGIDDGNIQRWGYRDSVLYLHTLDNRDLKNIKEAYRSLDLSRVSQK